MRQLKDVAPAVAERAFLRLLYGEHPYGHLAIGNDAALRALSIADVSAFHSGRFVPSESTMVMAGDMTHDAMRALARGVIRRLGEPSRSGGRDCVPARSSLPDEPKWTTGDRSAGRCRAVRAADRALCRPAANTPDYPALLVMNSVLGGQFVSRVNLKLREEKGYTYGARTGFDWRRGRAPFSLHASVHTAATADAVRDAHAELEGLRGARPVTATELTLAKASVTRGYPRNFETAGQVARAVAQLALYGLPDTYFQEFVPKVNAVTGDEVTRVAAAYLDPAQTDDAGGGRSRGHRGTAQPADSVTRS